jgi:hypothetical protein
MKNATAVFLPPLKGKARIGGWMWTSESHSTEGLKSSNWSRPTSSFGRPMSLEKLEGWYSSLISVPTNDGRQRIYFMIMLLKSNYSLSVSVGMLILPSLICSLLTGEKKNYGKVLPTVEMDLSTLPIGCDGRETEECTVTRNLEPYLDTSSMME